MKVITRYPVVYQGGSGQQTSNLDGKSSSAQIKHFQNWSNKAKGTNLSVDGKWGRNTKNAWNKYGASYESAFAAASQTLADTFGPSASSSGGGSTKAPREKGQFLNKLTNLWGKAKDSGLVDKGKEMLGNTKMGQKAQGYKDQYSGGGSGSGSSASMDTSFSTPEEKKGMPKALKYTLIGLAVAGVLYGGYRMMNAKAAKA